MTDTEKNEIEARWGNTESVRRAARRRMAAEKTNREIEEMLERMRAAR